MLCPICAEEFQPRVALCPGCGCGLVPSSISETRPENRLKFVELCRPRGYPIAMIVKQMLEQNGISVLVKGGHSLSVLPQLAFGGELLVMVDSEQLEYARALYRAYFEGDDDTDFLIED